MFTATFGAPLQTTDIQFLHLLPCPGCLPQKRKAQFDTWVFGKAIDPDVPAKLFPTEMSYKVGKDGLQGLTV